MDPTFKVCAGEGRGSLNQNLALHVLKSCFYFRVLTFCHLQDTRMSGNALLLALVFLFLLISAPFEINPVQCLFSSPLGVASRTTYPPHCPSDVAGQGYCFALLTHYQLSCQQTDTGPVVFL